MDSKASVDQHSAPEDKIALFRSLFRGRDDVYPRRFESRRTGKSGYAPACANEWVRGVCEKPNIKCADCPHRRFLPLTDEVIRQHLTGHDEHGRDFVAGIYPMLLDETCFFLAVDFDKGTWQQDASAYLQTCQRLNLPAALERSRSGKGGHVWLFFNEPIPAVLARKLGAHLLTEMMENRPDLGLDSYDRFFPNQDTLPQGGFGNLIALPLQHRPRANGNSLFVDEHLVPYPDQWSFLAQLGKISKEVLEPIVREAERRGRVVGVRLELLDDEPALPWTLPPSRRQSAPPVTGPLPDRLEIVFGNELYLPKEGMPPGLRNRLIRLAAFQNPEFYRAQAMRLPTYDKPRIIGCAEDHGTHLGLPRGCLEDVRGLLKRLNIEAVVRDERQGGTPLGMTFHGKLRPEQQLAASKMLAHETGVLAATTAFGKTVVAAWLIAKRNVNTLVLVHRRQLQAQWVERLSAFLGVPPKSIGQIGGGRKKPTGILDVAIIQSLVRKGVVNDLVGQYGHLVVDECHHLSAQSFEQVARRAKSKYVAGLSATVMRKDGHHPIIFMQCGPVRHVVDAKAQAAARPFEHTVLVRPTGFQARPGESADQRISFNALYDELIADAKRNRMICDEIVAAVEQGRSPVVLTERNEHLQFLTEQLTPRIQHVVVLRGGMGKKQLREVADQLAVIPPNAGAGTAGDRPLPWRRIRRRASRYHVPDLTGFMAWDNCSIRWPLASVARGQTRGARVRLRRSRRADAGANV